MARNFVAGERTTAIGDQLLGGKRAPGLADDGGRDDLAPLRVGYSEDRRLANRRMLRDDGLDFARIDIFATRHNHVFHAIADVEVPVRILVADVSGSKESAAERTFTFPNVLPVAARHILAARNQFA